MLYSQNTPENKVWFLYIIRDQQTLPTQSTCSTSPWFLLPYLTNFLLGPAWLILTFSPIDEETIGHLAPKTSTA